MSKHATLANCPRCKATVLETDWDHAYNVHVTEYRSDLTPLTPELETACIILARPTYSYHWHAGEPLLGTRNPAHTTYLSGGQPEHVLPAHTCGRLLPGEPLDLTPTTRAPLDDTHHPF